MCAALAHTPRKCPTHLSQKCMARQSDASVALAHVLVPRALRLITIRVLARPRIDDREALRRGVRARDLDDQFLRSDRTVLPGGGVAVPAVR